MDSSRRILQYSPGSKTYQEVLLDKPGNHANVKPHPARTFQPTTPTTPTLSKEGQDLLSKSASKSKNKKYKKNKLRNAGAQASPSPDERLDTASPAPVQEFDAEGARNSSAGQFLGAPGLQNSTPPDALHRTPTTRCGSASPRSTVGDKGLGIDGAADSPSENAPLAAAAAPEVPVAASDPEEANGDAGSSAKQLPGSPGADPVSSPPPPCDQPLDLSGTGTIHMPSQVELVESDLHVELPEPEPSASPPTPSGSAAPLASLIPDPPSAPTGTNEQGSKEVLGDGLSPPLASLTALLDASKAACTPPSADIAHRRIAPPCTPPSAVTARGLLPSAEKRSTAAPGSSTNNNNSAAPSPTPSTTPLGGLNLLTGLLDEKTEECTPPSTKTSARRAAPPSSQRRVHTPCSGASNSPSNSAAIVEAPTSAKSSAHGLGTRLPTSPERCDVVASPPAPPPAAPASSPLTSILVQATQTPPEVPLLPDTLPSSFVRKPAKPGAQRRVMRANQLPAGLMAPPTNNTDKTSAAGQSNDEGENKLTAGLRPVGQASKAFPSALPQVLDVAGTSVSGVGVTRDSMAAFAAMKKGSSDIKYTLFRIDQAHSGIVPDQQGSADHVSFLAALPNNEPRYAVYDFAYTNADSCTFNKLVFVLWAPDASTTRNKMLYASAKDFFKLALSGIAADMQATCKDELTVEMMHERVREGLTRQ